MRSSLLDALETNDALTNNGMVTNSTSSDRCLDMFFLAGASRSMSDRQIESIFEKAYREDRVTALKIMFWAGDIRQGAGERRFFKICLSWLAKKAYPDLKKYISYVPEFSRWDVIFDLISLDASCVTELIVNTIKNGGPNLGLLCKWLPRQSSVVDKKKMVTKKGTNSTITYVVRTKRKLHHGIAKEIRSVLGWSAKQYRKFVVEHSKVVEQQMSAKKWNEISYSAVPSVAMHKYQKAWLRNDEERYRSYLESVKKGEAKINASAIFPHTLVSNALYSGEMTDTEVEQWKALPNWVEGEVNSFLPVCDVSGSMWGDPLKVSVGLGLYLSERNTGAFKDAFITFSERPKLQVLSGDIRERVEQMQNAEWGMNTNLARVFQVILNRAVKFNVPHEEMPKAILIISDMEFDSCCSMSGFEVIKNMYEEAHYTMPNIVFWNVRGREGNIPVKKGQNGAALVSGCSPSIVKNVLTRELNPLNVMYKTINTERYSFIE